MAVKELKLPRGFSAQGFGFKVLGVGFGVRNLNYLEGFRLEVLGVGFGVAVKGTQICM